MTTTKPTPTEAQNELHTLALMIQEIQNAKGWSTGELMRRHAAAGLGSDKTFGKILNRDFTEMKVEDRVESYRCVLNVLNDAGAEEGPEPVFPDLVGPSAVRRGLTRAMMTKTIARVGVIEGESGSGKSSCLAVVRNIYGKRIVETEVRAAWKDSPCAFLGQVLRDLGEEEGPRNAERRQRKVEETLRTTRRCLILEEAHHLGPRCLDVVKSLINQTQTEAILAAIPTLLKRVEREAFEETLQLFRNRLAFRVKLKLHSADITMLLERRLPAPMSKTDLASAAELLRLNGPKHGFYALTREVCRRLRDQWTEEKFTRAVTLEDLTSATQTEIEGRTAA
ncbi:AAA family ATPase [Prosthecobacter sp.]|jgi:DNA transposition AAA+ family ATPase|uniref:AAA family ATPase n=1 Tax=Prosthecobacter sp. TaxID=1965333 RepID=UPI0037C5E2EF